MILPTSNKFIALLGDNWYEGYVVSSGHTLYSDFHFGYWEFCHHRHKEKAIAAAIDLTEVRLLHIKQLCFDEASQIPFPANISGKPKI